MRTVVSMHIVGSRRSVTFRYSGISNFFLRPPSKDVQTYYTHNGLDWFRESYGAQAPASNRADEELVAWLNRQVHT